MAFLKKYTGILAITIQLVFLSVMICNLSSCSTCSAESDTEILAKKSKYVLPFIGEKDFDYDSNGNVIDTLYHTIPPFYFTAIDNDSAG